MEILAQYGTKYNTEFHRWEVYSRDSKPHRGEVQPVFVAKTERKCLEYIERCKMMDLIYGEAKA